MGRMVRFGHQDVDVAPDQFRGCPTEDPQHRVAGGLDHAESVDGDDRVESRGENGVLD